MKKFLALVLALVMTMSLVTISAGAEDFTDADDITYVEAVEVMEAIGVVSGDTTGAFNPTAGLTRGAAAKIICNLILGPTTAAALNADTAPYSDVAVDSTFAGYIAYCQKEGIISGYADGTFKPAAPLTGYAFMKMLLGALGYEADVEGYTGANWSINVAKRALNVGLDDGLVGSFNGSKALTREEAMLYAFNALQADMVEYPNSSTISVGNVTVQTNAKASPVAQTGYINTMGGANLEFAEKYFSKLTKNTAGTDAFERPTTAWKNDKTEIGTYAVAADLTYTEAVKLGTIYSDLGLSANMQAAADATHAGVTFHRNGATEAASGNDNSSTPVALSTLGIAKGATNKIGGNGVSVEVYYIDPVLNATTGAVTVAEGAKVVLVDTYAGEVTSVRAATSTKEANITVTPLNALRGGNFETEDFAVEDIVTYQYSVKAGEVGVYNVVAAEQVVGELNGYTSTKSIKVDGVEYKHNAVAVVNTADLSAAIDESVTVTLDEYGFVLDVAVTDTTTNYAVVLKYSDATTWEDAKAELLFTDGTTKVVALNADTDKLGSASNLSEGDVVSYTINSKDKYVLTVLNDAVALTLNNYAFQTGNATMASIDGITAVNGKTIFLVATKNGTDTVYTAYVGIANVPDIFLSSTSTEAGVYAKTAGVATVVYVNATETGSSVLGSDKNTVFVLGNTTTTASYNSTKGTYWTYDAIVNGEVTTIDSSAQITSYAMYNTVTTDENGVVTLSNTTGITSGTGTDKEANGSITLNSTVLTYADDCEVFYIDTDENVSVSSIGGIAKDATDSVWYKVVDGEVVSVVIYQVVASTGTISAATATVGAGATGTVASVVVAGTTITVTGDGAFTVGDTITVTPTLVGGAAGEALTFVVTNSGSMADCGDIVVTSEDGTVTTTYTVVGASL